MKFGVVCLGLVLFLMQPGHGSRAIKPTGAEVSTTTTQKSVAKSSASAKTLFTRICATCHGADGRGETLAGKISGVPNMTDKKWQESISEKRMMMSVRNGRGSMPPFDEKLSQNEIGLLVAHIRNFKD
jgi:cytochrome c oxidase cbb3-type subunit 3